MIPKTSQKYRALPQRKRQTQSLIEALALKEAIIQINKLSYQNVLFCGDSAILCKQLERVTKVEHQRTSNVSIQTHLDDIMKLIEGKKYMFKHIKREENMRADHLVTLARNKNSPYVCSLVILNFLVISLSIQLQKKKKKFLK
ncbi:hypothetical protein BRARA_I03551 [Brassica rapa]|uniref:RNase H type-1 domain-containing protein n=1 Tax=Brassica campestris TaxID=3711 RepID=A0A397Y5B1_BRACM|nr:hypothetical protein BRARA_I03551 [Brassica rapa]